MASHPGVCTVEAYVSEAWHNITDEQKNFIIEKYKSHEEIKSFIEQKMSDFEEEDQNWRDYRNMMAGYIDEMSPEIKFEIDMFIKCRNTGEPGFNSNFAHDPNNKGGVEIDIQQESPEEKIKTIQGKYHRLIPIEILSILTLTDGWLVGSALSKLIEGEKVRDFDIIIHPDNWSIFIQHARINDNFNIDFNSNGGIKLNTKSGLEVDVWVSSLDKFLKSRAKYTHIFNFNSLVLLKSE